MRLSFEQVLVDKAGKRKKKYYILASWKRVTLSKDSGGGLGIC